MRPCSCDSSATCCTTWSLSRRRGTGRERRWGRAQGGTSVMKRTAVMTALVALAATAGWAQDHRVEIGGSAGWTLSDGVSGNGVPALDGNIYNSIEPKDSFSYSIDVGFYLTPHVEI